MTTTRARLRAPRRLEVSVPMTKPVARVARQLALAHHVERMIEAGNLGDYAAAARALGVTRARLTQIVGLTLLAPAIQERILLGDLCTSERAMRAVEKEPNWQEQLDLCAPASKDWTS